MASSLKSRREYQREYNLRKRQQLKEKKRPGSSNAFCFIGPSSDEYRCNMYDIQPHQPREDRRGYEDHEVALTVDQMFVEAQQKGVFERTMRLARLFRDEISDRLYDESFDELLCLLDTEILLTPEEVAKILGISTQSLQCWTTTGKVKCLKLGDSTTSRIRYRPSEIKRFIHEAEKFGKRSTTKGRKLRCERQRARYLRKKEPT